MAGLAITLSLSWWDADQSAIIDHIKDDLRLFADWRDKSPEELAMIFDDQAIQLLNIAHSDRMARRNLVSDIAVTAIIYAARMREEGKNDI